MAKFEPLLILFIVFVMPVVLAYLLLKARDWIFPEDAKVPFRDIQRDSFSRSPILSGKYVSWKIVAAMLVITLFPAIVFYADLTDKLVTVGYLPEALRPPHHKTVQSHSNSTGMLGASRRTMVRKW